jgi:glutamate dehydrogenase
MPPRAHDLGVEVPVTVSAEFGRAQHLEEVLKLVQAKVPAAQRNTIAAFVQRYYGQVDPEDLAERAPADLYGAALSHWNFARRRDPAHARVRVFNPSIEEHGWQSTHTIIEIVNDDMPFLVDSVTMEVNRHGLTLHLIIHPIVAVVRDADGTLAGVADDAEGAQRESLIHVEVDRIVDPAKLDELAADIVRVLDDVRAAFEDWKKMRDRVGAILAENEKRAPPLPPDELAEGRAFLSWLADGHFTFLGYRRHELVVINKNDALKIVPGSSLGILREGENKEVATSFAALPPEVKAYARRPELLVVTKSTSRSTVHRPGYLDYIAVKRFNEKGEVSGEDRFLGLFTSTAYSANPAEIPLLRRKIANVVTRAGLQPGSHAGKALINILETYPRDELFQTTEDELLRTAVGILHLGDRQRFRLFVRRDPFERFLSCLIHAPRENYTTELRQKWQQILVQAFNGTSSEFNVYLTEPVLARILITVRTTPGAIPDVDVRAVEAQLVAAARRWDDELKQALVEALGEARGNELFRQFGGAFPAGYREDFTAREAVPDIQMMARLSATDPLAMSLYRPLEAPAGALRFKLFHLGEPVSLSDSLPMLERMGLNVLDERPHRVVPPGMPPVWMHDFGMQSGLADTEVEIDIVHQVFEEAFASIFRGEVENDDFNRLVLAASSCDRNRLLRMRNICARSGSARSLSSNRRSPRTRRSRTADRAVQDAIRSRARGGTGARSGAGARDRRRVRAGRQSVGGPGTAAIPGAGDGHDAHEFLAPRRRGPAQGLRLVQFDLAKVPGLPSRSRCSRYSSIRRGSKASTCAAARSRVAACAGPIGRKTSAPKSSGWSRRRWSRTGHRRSIQRRLSCQARATARRS